MPGSTVRTQAAAKTRAPLTSTVHTRHTPMGVCSCAWQSTGMSMPRVRAASSTVLPEGTSTPRPSMLSSTVPMVIVTLIVDSLGHRAHVGRTVLVHDVRLDLVVEVLDDRPDGRRRDLAQPADGRLGHGMGQIGDEVEVLGAAPTGRDPDEDLRQLHRSHPARDALAAGLVAIEPH